MVTKITMATECSLYFPMHFLSADGFKMKCVLNVGCTYYCNVARQRRSLYAWCLFSDFFFSFLFDLFSVCFLLMSECLGCSWHLLALYHNGLVGLQC